MCSHVRLGFDWIWLLMLVPSNHLTHATPLLTSQLFCNIIHVKVYYTFTTILSEYYCIIFCKYLNLNLTKFISILNYIILRFFSTAPLISVLPYSPDLKPWLRPCNILILYSTNNSEKKYNDVRCCWLQVI